MKYAKIPNRAEITISGVDRHQFLEGLITNNTYEANQGRITYACLLTPQGKFLWDFFIREIDDVLYFDCESGERADALFKKLKLYKLHSKIELELKQDINVYAVWDGDMGYKDPRHDGLGYRSYDKPNEGVEVDFAEWDEIRIRMNIPDGSRDMIVEKSTLLECGLDKLNAIDFKKGCYVGQELTARMYYKGLAKKGLYAAQFDGKIPKPYSDIMDDNGKLIGEMRSSSGNVGLVLIKKDKLDGDLPFKLI